MNTRTSTRLLATLAAGAVTLSLTACTPDAEPTDDQGSPSPVAAEQTPTAEPEPTADVAVAAPATGDQPTWAEWAEPVEIAGDLISTFMVEDLQIEVYQVTTAPAPRDSTSIDPDTYQPIVKEGDDIVFLNYVVTNTGPDLPMTISLADIGARYEDWRFVGGMNAIPSSALYEEHGLSIDGRARGVRDDWVLGAGESYAQAINFLYRPDVPFTIKVSVTPQSPEGEMMHDERFEGEGTAVLS